MFIKKECSIVGLTALTVALGILGVSCFSTTSSTSSFSSKSVSLSSSQSTYKSWQTPQIIDPGAVDLNSSDLNHDQNTELGATGWRFPMAVFNTAAESFFAIFNRADAPPTGVVQNVYTYATSPVSFSSNTWASGLGYFIRVDGDSTVLNPGADSIRPIATVDSNGNATVVVFTPITENATTYRRPLAVRRNATSGTWNTPSRITNLTETGDVSTSAAIAADSNNNTVVVWWQNSSLYFNEYRSSLGWRYVAGSSSHVTWHNSGGMSPLDLGVDVGFDSYGNGYGAYVESTGTFGKISIVRWKGDNSLNWVTTDLDTYQSLGTPTAADDMFPRVFVASSGAATVFFYRNYDSVSDAELWYSTTGSNSSSTAGGFGAESQFDSSVGTGTVRVVSNSDILPPILGYKGNYAAVGFIKSDGSVRRLYVSRFDGSSWGTPEAVDSGIGHVISAEISVNSSGDTAVAYAALGSDGNEHAYANVYRLGSWQGVNQLDTNTRTDSGSATALMRPAVSIDSNGNVLVTFSIDDNTTYYAPARRRIIGVLYK